VFGIDAILNAKFEADWNFIKSNNQKLINTNNSIENKKRIKYTYQMNEQLLCEGKPTSSKFGPAVLEGPFEIVKINNNGSVCIRKCILRQKSGVVLLIVGRSVRGVGEEIGSGKWYKVGYRQGGFLRYKYR
jgi:hypothetical protein